MEHYVLSQEPEIFLNILEILYKHAITTDKLHIAKYSAKSSIGKILFLHVTHVNVIGIISLFFNYKNVNFLWKGCRISVHSKMKSFETVFIMRCAQF